MKCPARGLAHRPFLSGEVGVALQSSAEWQWVTALFPLEAKRTSSCPRLFSAEPWFFEGESSLLCED